MHRVLCDFVSYANQRYMSSIFHYFTSVFVYPHTCVAVRIAYSKHTAASIFGHILILTVSLSLISLSLVSRTHRTAHALHKQSTLIRPPPLPPYELSHTPSFLCKRTRRDIASLSRHGKSRAAPGDGSQSPSTRSLPARRPSLPRRLPTGDPTLAQWFGSNCFRQIEWDGFWTGRNPAGLRQGQALARPRLLRPRRLRAAAGRASILTLARRARRPARQAR